MTPGNLSRRPPSHPERAHLHVAIIMDGNGRWATSRTLPRSAGHTVGVRTARTIVESAVRAGIGTLTLYAFSSDNWARPRPEVVALMRLFRRSLLVESKRCLANGVRQAILQAEDLTAGGRNLHLRVAIDYSSRDAILRAAAKAKDVSAPLTRERFGQLLADVDHDPAPVRDVDLLIRTGGEQRLSDFLLWECAYAEFVFLPTMWPDFSEEDLVRAIRDFEARERRFGRIVAGTVARADHGELRSAAAPFGFRTCRHGERPSPGSRTTWPGGALPFRAPAESILPQGSARKFRQACAHPDVSAYQHCRRDAASLGCSVLG